MAKVYVIKGNYLEDEQINVQEILSRLDLKVDMVIGNWTIPATNNNDCQEVSQIRYHSTLEFGLELARMFRLLKNEKTLLMTNEDMFTKISLILSRIQKEVLEDGDINVSDVLDAFNKIKEATLIKDCTVMSNDNTDMTQAAAKEYMSDLKCQNLIDPWSLFKKLNTFWKSNDQVNDHDAIKFVNKANVLMVLPDHFNDPKMADIQIAKLLFSAKSHQLYELVLEDTLENSHAIIKEVQFPGFKVSKIGWNDVEGTMQTKYKPLHSKRDEKYNLQLFLGYLKLLTNSRDELSLAKVICGAGGILNHNAFNALKKESLQTKMPMYQTLVSHVQRIELGGKSYAPSACHPLMPYNREFSQFAQLMNKLNTRIEDDKEPDVALKKILNLVKFQICKNNTGKLKTSTLDQICEKIMEIFAFSTERFETIQNWFFTKHEKSNLKQFETPERSVGSGGSVVGRKNKKAIRYVVDHFTAAIINHPVNLHVLLGKIEPDIDVSRTPNTSSLSCSISPTSFPNLISLFKTPDINISEDKDIAEESLGKRLGLDKVLGTEKDNSKQTKGVPKFTAHLAWAEETSPILLSPTGVQETESVDENSGRIIFHDTESKIKDNISTPLGPSKVLGKTNIAEIIQEAKQDAENALKEAKQAKKPPKTCPKRSILKDINKVNKYPIESKHNSEQPVGNGNCPKRIKISGAENVPLQSATNKHALPKKVQGTKSKKYVAPLKGQMKMTAFLRM